MVSHSPVQEYEHALDAGAGALADAISDFGRRGAKDKLRNPLIHAMMSADEVGSEAVATLLRTAAQRLGLKCTHRRGPAASAC